jgi:protein-disulfide isomerase
MHDLIYSNQSAQSDADLAAHAEQLGLDMPQWQSCFTYGTPNDHISADMQQAYRARVGATPSFFANGLSLVGNLPLPEFLATIDEAEARARASGLAQASYYSASEGQGCL